MKAIVYHGTTKAGYEAIMAKKSINEKSISVWNCSERDSNFYVWGLFDEYRDEDKSYRENDCRNRAIDSAQCQAAINGENEIYVLGFEVEIDPEREESEEDFSEDIELDSSCENMSGAFTLLFDGEVIPEPSEVWRCDFNQYLSPFIVSSLLDNPHFNDWNADETLLKAAEIIKNSNIHLDPEDLQSEDLDLIG